jgi:hypothetical protein
MGAAQVADGGTGRPRPHFLFLKDFQNQIQCPNSKLKTVLFPASKNHEKF